MTPYRNAPPDLFGKSAHVVFCVFALVTNLVIMIGLLLAGRATIQSLTRDASDEFCLFVMAILFGSYSLIGGIGTTFYVSYFNVDSYIRDTSPIDLNSEFWLCKILMTKTIKRMKTKHALKYET
jgi:hypothetical protein